MKLSSSHRSTFKSSYVTRTGAPVSSSKVAAGPDNGSAREQVTAQSYRLRPSRSAITSVELVDSVLSRHLHLAGDDAFHEEAIQDLAEQQMLKGRGAVVFYPANSDSFLPAMRAVAAQSGREQDLVVLDFLGEESTHSFEPAYCDSEYPLFGGYFSWLVHTLASRSSSIVPHGEGQLRGVRTVTPEEQANEFHVELFERYAEILLYLRNTTTLTDLIEVMGSTDIPMSLIESVERKATEAVSFPSLKPPPGYEPWQERLVSRLTRLQKVCRTAGKAKPTLSPTPSDVRTLFICVPMPDLLERQPSGAFSEPLVNAEVTLLLALGVLSRMMSLANSAYRDVEPNSFLLIAPELQRWAPKEVGRVVDQARGARIGIVQYTRTPLSAVDKVDVGQLIENQAYSHVGRTMDAQGRLVLVHFTLDSNVADVIPEA